MVCPSGGDFATASTAITPPAPVRCSMTTGWPSSFSMCGWIARATTSALPPGANPRMKRIGLVGNGLRGGGLRHKAKRQHEKPETKLRHVPSRFPPAPAGPQ